MTKDQQDFDDSLSNLVRQHNTYRLYDRLDRFDAFLKEHSAKIDETILQLENSLCKIPKTTPKWGNSMTGQYSKSN